MGFRLFENMFRGQWIHAKGQLGNRAEGLGRPLPAKQSWWRPFWYNFSWSLNYFAQVWLWIGWSGQSCSGMCLLEQLEILRGKAPEQGRRHSVQTPTINTHLQCWGKDGNFTDTPGPAVVDWLLPFGLWPLLSVLIQGLLKEGRFQEITLVLIWDLQRRHTVKWQTF